MDFTQADLENAQVHFRDLLRKLTPSEQLNLYRFINELLQFLLEREGRQ